MSYGCKVVHRGRLNLRYAAHSTSIYSHAAHTVGIPNSIDSRTGYEGLNPTGLDCDLAHSLVALRAPTEAQLHNPDSAKHGAVQQFDGLRAVDLNRVMPLRCTPLVRKLI